MRRLLTYVFLLLATAVQAQRLGEWRNYLCYRQVTEVQKAPSGTLYVLASGNLFCYDTTDNSVWAYSKMQGLHDHNISHISWNKATRSLLVVYANSNVDVMLPDGDVANMSDIFNKNTSADKHVNSVAMDGSYAYLSTEGLGVICLDMQKLEVHGTYAMRDDNSGVLPVLSTTIIGDNIYASCKGKGIYRAATKSNLYDPDSWTLFSPQWFSDIYNLEGQLIGLGDEQPMSLISLTDGAVTNLSGAINYDHVQQNSDGSLIMSHSSKTRLLPASLSYEVYDTPANSCIIFKDDDIYWGRSDDGRLTSYRLEGTQFQKLTEGIAPDGPRAATCAGMAINDGKLYVAAGGYLARTGDQNNDGLVMTLDMESDEWQEFESNIGQPRTLCEYKDQNNIAIDPRDKRHVMVGGRTGLYEFLDGKFVRRFGKANGLISMSNSKSERYSSVPDVKYDSQGNLYFLNGKNEQPLGYIPATDVPTDDYVIKRLTNVSGNTDDITSKLESLVIDEEDGYVWFCNTAWSHCVLYGYNLQTGETLIYNDFINEDDQRVVTEATQIYYLTLDDDHNLWLATSLGPIYLARQNKGQAGATFVQHKVPRNDGTNLADYLLAGISITCVAVDGANRKWFGTEDNGIYCVSADNNTEIHHFTAANSPLLNDKIYDIAINGSDGTVYFSTDKGLCSYVSDASHAAESMDKETVWAYPNPVEPDYTGLVSIVGLTRDANVIIATANGNKVAEGVSNGGTFTWDCRDTRGNRVASGIYNVITSTADGKRGTVCKIAVVN